MTKTLQNLMKETAINESSEKGTLSLILAVLLKYGMAPLACIYLAYVNYGQGNYINNKLTNLIEVQTSATVKNTEVQGQLVKVIEANTRKLEEIERKK